MIFVDTNVFMYAVGKAHPLKEEARAFLLSHVASGAALATSAEVIQELLHAYLPVGRLDTLDAALSLARGRMGVIWAMEWDDVQLARSLVSTYPALGARDLLHLACCTRRGVERVKTFDRALAAAFGPQ